jgi:hypothetical protein
MRPNDSRPHSLSEREASLKAAYMLNLLRDLQMRLRNQHDSALATRTFGGTFTREYGVKIPGHGD